MASTYTTPVRYYTDDVDDRNWIGSSTISYRVIDFTTETTLYDLGFNLNAYKPTYCDDGILQYTGPVNFTALRELTSIDVLYENAVDPDDPSEIDYPHRFLFLQHNDLGAFEDQHPNWTMNHAYINTGVSVDDMSKLTVVMECDRVDDNVPLHEVNAGYAYLFGSSSPAGSFYMRFNNQTMYGTNLTGVNTYEAKAGLYSNQLTLTEDSAIGFSENTGIYASARDGYSIATFTYSNQIQTEHAQMPYPLFLFANNNAGSYADGLGGIGIYGCRIYYDNELIRDFIPVQFYDKIGDKVAPSNCLYDKVSKAFFEDGTGMNSFNIIDDERYPSSNPAHKIGQYYVKYYQNNVLFKMVSIPFRGDEFDKEWDWDERLHIADFQLPYHKAGEVLNKDQFPVINFETVNNAIFEVNYEEIKNQVQVYYYKDSISDENLLANDVITLTEKDFYQVPTFGDLIRLNKYRPDGYKTDFQYPGSKVSLNRVVENQPYHIVYVPETETPNEYTTTIKYQRKIWGPHTYETLGSTTITLNDSQFRDGEYIDFFVDFNLFKPEKYYGDGEPYEWYLLDNRLDKPEDLKSEYIVAYQPTSQSVEVNYYTDDIDEANLIASTDWVIQIDEFDGPFYLVDMLPNEYINKFKPVNCDGGLLQNTDVLYTFDELLTKGTIEIMYESVAEPEDPTNASYIQKVLYWNIRESSREPEILGNKYAKLPHYNGGTIPYIDLGYKPKEIGRLAVDTKMYLHSNGFKANTCAQSFQSDDYLYGFGYVGAIAVDASGAGGKPVSIQQTPGSPKYYEKYPDFSPCSSGGFAIRPRIPVAETGAYSDGWFRYLDGQKWTSTSNGLGTEDTTITINDVEFPYEGIIGKYRKGKYEDTNIDYEPFIAYNTYGQEKTITNSAHTYPYAIGSFPENEEINFGSDKDKQRIVNPFTVKLDAYNSRGEIYNYSDSNTPTTISFNEDKDIDTFDNRCKPKGSLTLFRTRNPDTGKMNIMAFTPITYPQIGQSPPGTQKPPISQMLNPYSDKYNGSIVEEVLVIKEVLTTGKEIYEWKKVSNNVEYATVPIEIFPQLDMGAIWYMKIYDQGRLVRDLIPVAKGDKIYDYVMPEDGLFDLITEIFFGNSNQGGKYEMDMYGAKEGSIQLIKYHRTCEITADQVCPLHCIPDPMYWGKITENYYDYDNKFINNQYVDVPTWFHPDNDTIENILQFNDFKPNDFYLDGMLDTDNPDNPWEEYTLKDVYDASVINVYYKLRTFAKTITYYQDNVRVGTKDIFFSLEDIDKAQTLADLGIDVDLYWTEDFKHGRVVFNEKILAEDDVSAFIDAPSPIVVYDKLDAVEAPNLLYLEYYRGGAYDDTLITLDENDVNYLNCNLEGVVLNPNGAIKYYNHYHDALYEDEEFNYFMPYQVRVLNKYTPIHYGPGRKYKTLAQIVERDTYTIIDERNGWGRLKEYYHGWILLNQTEPMTGPGQNPDYDVPGETTATIPFAERIQITRLTIDRLWCYVPAVESWIKAEDVSFDQAGSLYHGLAMKVIHLDEVDWSNVSTLADIGIYPEAYRLQYHGYSGYTYDGEYTQEAFSAIHSLDFVYPETVYTSSCIYYKNCKLDENELGRVSISYTISDWNPDWDTFLETSWKVDKDGYAISPTLYRDTPLTLDWDYYGFERDAYRPDGYYEGFYCWNPRSWNDEKLNFTFEDLVSVGTQYVIYPSWDWTQFKVKLPYRELTNGYQQIGGTRYTKYADWGLLLGDELVDDTGNRLPQIGWGNKDNAIYDIQVCFAGKEFLNDPSADIKAQLSFQDLEDRFDGVRDNQTCNGLYKTTTASTLYTANDKRDKVIMNLSTHRNASRIDGEMNTYLNKDSKYYVYDWVDKNYDTITPATNLNDANYHNTSKENGQTKFYIMMSHTDFASDNGAFKDENHKNQACCSYVKIYANNALVAFYAPAPSGMWYQAPDNTMKQVPYDSFVNLINMEVFKSLKPTTKGNVGSLTNDEIAKAEGKVAYTDQNMNDADYKNIFDNWHYETSDINYIVQTTADTNSYRYPDALSLPIRNNLKSGLIIPVSKLTSDSANNVVGEWYGFNQSTSWIQSSKTKIYSGSDFDVNKLSAENRQEWTFLSPDKSTAPTSIRVYYGPTENKINSKSMKITNSNITTYYTYDGAYGFNGQWWFKLENTNYNTIGDNKNYVTVSQINIYSRPDSTNDTYKIGTYLLGDRLTVLYRASYNSSWCYTGMGWIYNDNNNLSLIV